MQLSKKGLSLGPIAQSIVRDFKLSSVAVLALAALTHIGLAAAGTLTTQIQEDLNIGEQLVNEENSLNQVQTKLGDARTKLLAMGAALDNEQQALNRDVDLHNQQVSEQKDAISKNREKCNSKGNLDGGNTTEHINQCNNSIKTINGSSAAIDAQNDTLASRQADLNARFANYQKEVDSLNEQAMRNSDSVNKNLKNTTNWLNFSYALLASPEFQREVRITKETQACGSGIREIEASARDPTDLSARFVLACLRALRQHERN